MSAEVSAAGTALRGSVFRILADVAHVLNSAADAETRLHQVLVSLRDIVPYDRCALLVEQPGSMRVLTLVPPAEEPERAALEGKLARLFGLVTESAGPAAGAPSGKDVTGSLAGDSYLAVPLISLDPIGVLFVERGGKRAYRERELRLLSIVASQVAAYLTELRLQAENLRLCEEARAANAAKDDFIATLSHELRAPLNAIIGWAHVLKRARDDATVQRALDTIERNARHQTTLINDLLDITRIVQGRIQIEPQALECEPVIAAALQMVRPAAEAKGIVLETALAEGVGLVWVDPARLQQVLTNLLVNAVKFTPAGGRVEVRLERAGSEVQITVADTGEGIRRELLPVIFDRFRQGDTSPSRAHGGLGLGLAIAKHLVDLHGGRIEAASAGEGKGATFTVRLPLQSSPIGKEATGRRAAGPSCAGLRVLVVDDEADARDLASAMLVEHGATVGSASSAAEALAAIDRERPDALVCDLAIPGQDGFALVRAVRAGARHAGDRIPVVALTAHAGSDTRGRALAEGFDLYLTKPVDAAELAAAVATVVSQRRG